jgi:hypothetical protein
MMDSGEVLDEIWKLVDPRPENHPGFDHTIHKVFQLIRDYYEEIPDHDNKWGKGRRESREIYAKVGDEYVKLGRDFTGWPADGVWLVRSDGRSASHISEYIGGVDYTLLAGMMTYSIEASNVLHKALNSESYILADIVRDMFKAVLETHIRTMQNNVIETLEEEITEQTPKGF